MEYPAARNLSSVDFGETHVGMDSYRAALLAAGGAVGAVESVVHGGYRFAFSACRPPGHHAGRRHYGGYCLFNNAYVAARELATGGRCCPVLDVDYHLGEGSAELANEANPYFSLHADPWSNYPHLDAGWSVAQPEHVSLAILADGTEGLTYLRTLEAMITALMRRKPDALVLSLGFDTAARDPIQDHSVGLAMADFEAIGALIGATDLPLAVILEGGYDMAGLGDYAAAFARGLSVAGRG